MENKTMTIENWTVKINSTESQSRIFWNGASAEEVSKHLTNNKANALFSYTIWF